MLLKIYKETHKKHICGSSPGVVTFNAFPFPAYIVGGIGNKKFNVKDKVLSKWTIQDKCLWKRIQRISCKFGFHSFCCFSFICFKVKYRQQEIILFLNALLIVCFQTLVQDSPRKYPEHPKNDPGPNTFNNEQ